MKIIPVATYMFSKKKDKKKKNSEKNSMSKTTILLKRAQNKNLLIYVLIKHQ